MSEFLPSFRSLLDKLYEDRRDDIEYDDAANGKSVTAFLKSTNSMVYTKLAQKLDKVSKLEKEIKDLKEEIKQSTREDVADLFAADDAVKTRVVETVSFVFTLSKNPEASVTPKYKEILTELEQHLTPELISVLEGLKKSMVTVVQRSPSIKVQSLKEGKIRSFFSKLKDSIFNWGRSYDQKLDRLKALAAN